jgi:1-acyl-sn-glycerol-3-phosphate acyltransferase
VTGLENIPTDSSMIVANHSGYAVMEIFLLLAAWNRRHRGAIPVAAALAFIPNPTRIDVRVLAAPFPEALGQGPLWRRPQGRAIPAKLH